MKLTRMEMAAVKSVAKITKPLYNKLGKLEAKRDALQQEIDDLLAQIEKWEYPITSRYGCLPNEIINNDGSIPEAARPADESHEYPDTLSCSEESAEAPFPINTEVSE